MKLANQKGFTLIEVVIVIGIFSLLMIALLDLFDWHNKIFLLERADTEATGSARTAMNNMTENISQASSVVTSHTFGSTTYTTGTNTLVLQIPSYNSSGNIITGTYDYVAYYKSGNALYQILEAGSGSARKANTKQLATNAATLTFTTDYPLDVAQATNVIIDLQTQATIRGNNTSTAHVTNTIFLRNHL